MEDKEKKELCEFCTSLATERLQDVYYCNDCYELAVDENEGKTDLFNHRD